MSNLETVRLYKFYGLDNALRNLRQRRVKISTIDDLNDPFEFNSFALGGKNDRLRWKKVRKQLWSDKGIICFSERWRSPLMWSHYADNHKGLCLGFDVARSKMKKVEYEDARELIISLKSLVADGDEDPFKRHTSVKYSHWSYEEEWRAFCRLKEKDDETGLYFVDFSNDLVLRELIIGAESDCTSATIRELFEGELCPNIITARLSFKDFAVVKQKEKSLWK